ncbi:MAG: hypothetical protein WBN93_10985, partial [Acidimicrobiia bacterium]
MAARQLLLLPAMIVGFVLALGVAPALAGEVTAEEQQFIYDLNEARRDPAAYAATHLSGSLRDLIASYQA